MRFEEKADSCRLNPLMGSVMSTKELMGERAVARLRITLWWESQVILDRSVERGGGGAETDMGRVHVGGGSLWHRHTLFNRNSWQPLSSNVQDGNSKPHCVKSHSETQVKALINAKEVS